jgi:hypothetical protein
MYNCRIASDLLHFAAGVGRGANPKKDKKKKKKTEMTKKRQKRAHKYAHIPQTYTPVKPPYIPTLPTYPTLYNVLIYLYLAIRSNTCLAKVPPAQVCHFHSRTRPVIIPLSTFHFPRLSSPFSLLPSLFSLLSSLSLLPLPPFVPLISCFFLTVA